MTPKRPWWAQVGGLERHFERHPKPPVFWALIDGVLVWLLGQLAVGLVDAPSAWLVLVAVASMAAFGLGLRRYRREATEERR